jgi:CRISPR/Cas system CSM-associated protein Csm3 (group 7 of RAMP superfamily)
MEVPVEKPYEFVPFPERGPQRTSPAGHQEFSPEHLSGTLSLRLVARRPVQVASGYLDVVHLKSGDEVVAQDVTTRRQGQEVHVLPGSSLKGVLRSVVEALSPSCVRVTSWQTRQAVPKRFSACDQVTRLCPACRLFGMTGRGKENYLGQVQVEDGLLVEGKPVVLHTPLLWTPARSRRGLPRRYLAGREAIGRKFYYHGVPAAGRDARMVADTGSVFSVQIHFENLTPGELGLLLAAMGQHPNRPFLLKLGAAKPVGLGSIAVEVSQVTLLGDVRRGGRAGTGVERPGTDELKERTAEWIAAAEAEGLLDSQALVDVWAILRAENLSRPSPEGLY